MYPTPWAPLFLLAGCIYVTAALNLPPPLYQNVNSPCDIMNQVAAASSCTRGVIPSRYWGRGDLQVIPSHCTCNELFYNLWSACSQMLNTHTTSPSFTTWQEACKNKQIDVDASSQWASTFQIQTTHIRRGEEQVGNKTGVVAAVSTGDSNKHGWTTMQKIAPVITGVGVLLVAGIAFLIYRRKRRGPYAPVRWRTRLEKLLPRTKDVHTIDRSSTWTIEQFDTGYDEFVFVEPAPLSPAATSSEGHNFQPFSAISSTVKETTPNHKPIELHTERQIPGKAPWGNMHLPEALSFPRIPLPWKKRPIRVQHVPHTHRFRVDDFDQSTDASSSRRATSNFSSNGHGTTVENSSAAAFSRVHGAIEEEDESEHTSLITPQERSENSVFLISRVPGVDFSSTESGSTHPRSSTVPSQIQVQSPTPTTATPSSAGANIPFRPNQSSPLTIPPVPTLPAPVPPESSRWIPRIPEEDEYELPSSPPPSLLSFSSHVRNRSGPYPPSQLERKASDDSMFSAAQSSSMNEYGLSEHSSPLNGYGILATPSSGHGHLSEDNEHYFQRQQAHNRERSLESILRPSPANLPRIITHEDAVGRRPRAPSAVAGVELQPPVGHHRNISAESFAPAPHDPVMLYPGAARAAGYMAQGSVSSESLYSQASQPSMKIQPNRRPSS